MQVSEYILSPFILDVGYMSLCPCKKSCLSTCFDCSIPYRYSFVQNDVVYTIVVSFDESRECNRLSNDWMAEQASDHVAVIALI